MYIFMKLTQIDFLNFSNIVNVIILLDIWILIQYIFSPQGPTNLLHHLNVPNTLVLKEGAPVMLTRNLPGGLCNGARGKVHLLKKDCAPVINIDGKLIEVPQYRFEVYSPEQSKVLPVALSTQLFWPMH